MPGVAGCPLCEGPGGELVWQGPRFRVVRTDEGGFPAFYRLVWNDHVREFSQLSRDDRVECVDALVAIEEVLIAVLRPDKVNLASLGNAVPHLHWHVVARFRWDSHFPAPVWAAAARTPSAADLQGVLGLRQELHAALQAALERLPKRTSP
jgi:diadenosine tetraphosphate (Ap4A) HIT family hydrolase